MHPPDPSSSSNRAACCVRRSSTCRTSRRSSASCGTTRSRRSSPGRFVAGETLDTAIAAVRALNAKKITASLDLLGESVTNEAEARAASAEYLADARPDPRREARCERQREAHADGARPLGVALRGDHARHPRAREAVRDLRAAGHGGEQLHRAHAQDVREPALPGLREERGHGAAELSVPHRGRRGARDRAQRAGAALQGRVPGAADGRVPGQEGRGRDVREVHAHAHAAAGTIRGSRRTTRRSSPRRSATRRSRGSRRRVTSSKCCTACGATCRTSS